MAAVVLIPLLAVGGSDSFRAALDFTTGVLSLVSLTASVAWGLIATDRLLLSVRHRLLAQAIHRTTAVASLGFLLLHATVKVSLDHTELIGALIPFGLGLTGSSGLIGFGSLAGLLMVIAASTGAARSALAGRGNIAARWRPLHMLAYPAWCAALVHGLYAGRPAATWVVVMYSLALTGVAAAVSVRMLPRPVQDRLAGRLLALLGPGTTQSERERSRRDLSVSPLPGAADVPAPPPYEQRIEREPAEPVMRPVPTDSLLAGPSAAQRSFGSPDTGEPLFGRPDPAEPLWGRPDPSAPSFGDPAPSGRGFGGGDPERSLGLTASASAEPSFGTPPSGESPFGGGPASPDPLFGGTGPSEPLFGSTGTSEPLFGGDGTSDPLFSSPGTSDALFGSTDPGGQAFGRPREQPPSPFDTSPPYDPPAAPRSAAGAGLSAGYRAVSRGNASVPTQEIPLAERIPMTEELPVVTDETPATRPGYWPTPSPPPPAQSPTPPSYNSPTDPTAGPFQYPPAGEPWTAPAGDRP
ncbi:hypothetical protein ACF1G0_00610 [Streptomyces sp. NPDC013953]|uniref:hypothetical protein n=1 Tax=Streptomyces sp. NPDC013953 TaxID=3364868 RepID=UPI0036FFEBF5